MMTSDPVFQVRVPPTDPTLVAQARANAGGWVYDIDFDYAEEDAVPPEAIRGAWEVADSGVLTGRYQTNERYRPIVECARPLKSYVHASAKFSPGKWISEIDPRGENMFPDIPESLIVGWWLIDEAGVITKQFRNNSRYVSSYGNSVLNP